MRACVRPRCSPTALPRGGRARSTPEPGARLGPRGSPGVRGGGMRRPRGMSTSPFSIEPAGPTASVPAITGCCLIHLDQPYRSGRHPGAGHQVGYADDIARRVQTHRMAQGVGEHGSLMNGFDGRATCAAVRRRRPIQSQATTTKRERANNVVLRWAAVGVSTRSTKGCVPSLRAMDSGAWRKAVARLALGQQLGKDPATRNRSRRAQARSRYCGRRWAPLRGA
jgi:hypothetical protein